MENETQGAPVAGYEAKEKANVPEARKALVKDWCEKILNARKHHEDAFKRMRLCADLAADGAEKDWVDADKYVVPIVNRHINQSVAALYARNPKAVVKRKRKLMFNAWDGRMDTLQNAMEMAAMGDPMAMQIVQEVAASQQQNLMLDRIAQTLEALFDYYFNEQSANYKMQLKALARRAKVRGAGFVKLGFQRVMEPRPEITAEIEDVTSKIRAAEVILAEMAEGEDEPDQDAPQMEELRTLLADLQAKETMVVREGPVLDFPRPHELTIDPACRHLKSFAGARWVAHMYEMSPERVVEVYDVDVGDEFTRYRPDGKGGTMVVTGTEETDSKCMARVHEIWDRRNRQVLTICEGYCDFLRGPAEPDVQIERFWPFFPLVFNEIEHDDQLYPPSDVWLAKHIQNEYNRSREGLREHRVAARPYYAVSGRIEEQEYKKLANHSAHELIVFPTLATGEKIGDLVQRGETVPIDPNLYEVEMHFTDLLRAVGTQEANLGGTSNGTATESSIAEQSRSASLADNVDDLDEMLSDLAKAMGQLMMSELSKDTVVEIVGPGAVWPDLKPTREELSKDLMLDIKAGSSGRPNKAAELANLERAMPVVLQIPGVNPEPFARKYCDLLDVSWEDAIATGMPSVMSLNAMMAKMATGPGAAQGAAPTGDPTTDPNAQGAAGAQNAPQGQPTQPGPQPGYPAPAA